MALAQPTTDEDNDDEMEIVDSDQEVEDEDPNAKNDDFKSLSKAIEPTLTFKESLLDFFKGFWIAIRFLPFLKLCGTAFLIFNGF